MPADITPAAWFPGVSTGTNTIIFNTADHATDSLPQLTNAEAAADARKIVHAFLEQVYQKYSALAAGDRPAKLAINRSSTLNVNGTTTLNYTCSLIVASSTPLEVVDE